MGKRKAPRKDVELEVRIFGLDNSGKPFSKIALTLDVSRTGARLKDVDIGQPGDVIGLQYGDRKTRFKVIWVESKGERREAGIVSLEQKRRIWGLDLPETGADDFKSAAGDEPVLSDRPERRSQPRKALRTGAKVKNDGKRIFSWGTCLDLSPGGCFIQTWNPPPVGTHLDITLKAGDSELELLGVVRNVKPEKGMGIEFIELFDEDIERIKALVKTGPVFAGPTNPT